MKPEVTPPSWIEELEAAGLYFWSNETGEHDIWLPEGDAPGPYVEISMCAPSSTEHTWGIFFDTPDAPRHPWGFGYTIKGLLGSLASAREALAFPAPRGWESVGTGTDQ